jgi:hypothetical protein
LRTKRHLGLLGMSNCEVLKRKREVYSLVKAPPLAKTKSQMHNCPRNCADSYVDRTHVPITRTASYRAPWQDMCEVVLGFSVAAQLMNLVLSLLRRHAARQFRPLLRPRPEVGEPVVPDFVQMPTWKSVQVIVLIYFSNHSRETLVVCSHHYWLPLPCYYRRRALHITVV